MNINRVLKPVYLLEVNTDELRTIELSLRKMSGPPGFSPSAGQLFEAIQSYLGSEEEDEPENNCRD